MSKQRHALSGTPFILAVRLQVITPNIATSMLYTQLIFWLKI